jgi:hypothetical protein
MIPFGSGQCRRLSTRSGLSGRNVEACWLVESFVVSMPGVNHNDDSVEDRLVEVFDGRAVAFIIFSAHTSHRGAPRWRPANFREFTSDTGFGFSLGIRQKPAIDYATRSLFKVIRIPVTGLDGNKKHLTGLLAHQRKDTPFPESTNARFWPKAARRQCKIRAPSQEDGVDLNTPISNPEWE